MESPNKLKAEELNKIKEFQQKYQSVAVELGNIELQTLALKERRSSIEQFLSDLKADEQKFADELKAEYGNIDIDLATGTFTKIGETTA